MIDNGGSLGERAADPLSLSLLPCFFLFIVYSSTSTRLSATQDGVPVSQQPLKTPAGTAVFSSDKEDAWGGDSQIG